MTKHVLFILLFTGLCACKSKESDSMPTPVVAPVIAKEALGIRALSWIKPYLGKTSVTFEDSLGNKQIFAITETKIRNELHTHEKTIDGETFELFLTSKTNADQVFAFKPIGKNFILFGNSLRIDASGNNIFGIQFSRFFSEEYYWVGFPSPLNLNLDNITYTYGTIYPVEGGDSFELRIGKLFSFFSSFAATQSKGIDYYIDLNGVKWKQTLIQ